MIAASITVDLAGAGGTLSLAIDARGAALEPDEAELIGGLLERIGGYVAEGTEDPELVATLEVSLTPLADDARNGGGTRP